MVGFQKIVIDSERAQSLALFRLVQEPSVIVANEKVLEVLKERTPEEGWGIFASG